MLWLIPTTSNYCNGIADGLKRMAKDERKLERKLAIQAEKERLRLADAAEKAARDDELARLNRSVTGLDEKKAKVEDAGDTDVGSKDDVDRKPKVEDLKDLEASDNDDTDDEVDDSTDGSASHHGGQADFDDGDDVDNLLDLDAAEPKVNPAAVKPEPNVKVEVEDGDVWKTEGQLIQFRKDAESIADQYLAENKVKLGKGRKFGDFKFDRNAYEQGKPIWDLAAISEPRLGKRDARKIDVKQKRIEGAEK